MNTKESAGFTLIELMIVIAIAAILTVLAVPAMQSFIINNQLVTQTNSLVAALQLARSEAIKRGATVGVRPGPISAANDTGTATGTDWNQGWIVWVDTDSDGVKDNGERLLRTEVALSGGTTIVLVGSVALPSYINYLSSGFVKADVNPINLQLKNAKAAHNRTISISNTGRVSVADS